MNQLNLRGQTILVTGASSGIGLEISRLLAKEHGAHLILVARREQRLHALRDELIASAGGNVDVVVADLSTAEGVQAVSSAAIQADADAVILNAGVTHFGPHLELDAASFAHMLHVNVTSVVQISTEVAKMMTARRRGAIMVVSSLAGIHPVPYQTAYSATKAFVNAYGRGLQYELEEHGVSVTTFCPGGVRTEMTDTAGLSDAFDSDLLLMSPEQCAREAIAALREGATLRVAGTLNRVSSVAMKLVPQNLITKQMGFQYRRALKHRK